MSRLVLLPLFCGSLYANTLDATFKDGKTEGYMRVGLQHHDQQDSGTNLAIGGQLKYETGKFYGLNLGVAFYSVNGLHKKENLDVPFYTAQNRGYTLLGESYVEGTFQNTTLKLGRQTLDTPFLDSDDIGMIPNLFEAYTLINSDIPDTTIMISHVTKMAGIDAIVPDHFTKLNPGSGIQMISAIYEGIENSSMQAWFYHINNEADLLYLEAGYEDRYDQGTFSLGAQYSIQDYEDGKKADTIGLLAEVSHDKTGLALNLGYNKTDSKGLKPADNFFGGGPFMTSSEHLTIADAGANSKAFSTGVSFDAAVLGVKGFSLLLSKLNARGDEGVKMREIDFVASYAMDDNFTLDAIYSDMVDKKDKAASFKNMRVFANYRF